ncbi:hypothetical protein MDUV_05860 [Mycolicibacterium duvalii]|uniref:Uncharacterized protein n=1 Tax=Mycolicibacterium duvalii TaxID=39688 RepID=A0A7I7JV24_9MYCO|nr:hypothetical protein MDUV_05860 [Mycolicibacterium duvalii]
MHQRSDRGTVRGDMVHHTDQNVLLLGESEQRGPQRRLGGEIEIVTRHLVGGAADVGIRPPGGVDDLPAPMRSRGNVDDFLTRHTGGDREQGAQRFVAGHDVIERGAESVRVELSTQLKGHGHVVDRRGSLQLVDDPHPLLRERQRDHGGAVERHQGLSAVGRIDEQGCQPGNGGRIEKCAHRQIGVECSVHRRDEAHGQDAVSAEIEERIIHPDPVDVEELSEQAGQRLFGGRRGGPVCLAVDELGCGKSPGVELAVDRQRQALEHDDRGRHHVRRQSVPETLPDGDGIYCSAAGFGDITDESFDSGIVLAGDDDGMLDTVDVGERRTYLPEFDAVPADLDLLVGAAEVVQLPVAVPAHEVAGAVHPAAGSAEGARHEP